MIENRLEWAIIQAASAHACQTDKGRKPYVLHPLRVMHELELKGYGDDVLIAAVLHDVVEDTYVTLSDIREDFGDAVADMVDSVSRRKAQGETYRQFIERAKKHPLGRVIKIADIHDNMRPERMVPELKGLEKRYRMALNILEE